ncbi:hypothetical protein [Actinokineospora pegani]|uniref:hypothetical protein n=1 Tax=Actinokineospora pegani TaxID=2654637 RepID=UPI0012EA3338|nr:hypothetical protein [Actinokineospora pegani]
MLVALYSLGRSPGVSTITGALALTWPTPARRAVILTDDWEACPAHRAADVLVAAAEAPDLVILADCGQPLPGSVAHEVVNRAEVCLAVAPGGAEVSTVAPGSLLLVVGDGPGRSTGQPALARIPFDPTGARAIARAVATGSVPADLSSHPLCRAVGPVASAIADRPLATA